MLTEKQFNDAFTAAGGWFILCQYETVKTWKGSKADLIDLLYNKGFDAKRTGTSTRVNSLLRILDSKMDRQALEKIQKSPTINRQHPGAAKLAAELMARFRL